MSTFSRKHYNCIAGIIKEGYARNKSLNQPAEADAVLDMLVRDFVTAFSVDSKAFKPDVFRKACGYEG